MNERSLAPVHLVLGPVIWSAWFVLLYGGLSVACEFAPPDPEQGAGTPINVVMIASAVLLAVGLVYLSYRCTHGGSAPLTGTHDPARSFIRGMSSSMYVVSAAGIIALTIPSLVLPPCL
ncbi:hypothetical protein [Marinobacter lipolyticus]|uniref:hypothetical protein n=1 Tax=Marinobacter lipolyticus TaxID=209639 RepID=UPI001BD1B2EC|nr:hypothetical protein [Marinobacter lipolyticus]